MADPPGTLQRIATELGELLRPIASKLGDDEVLGTLADLGVRFPDALLTQPKISAARATVTGAAARLQPLLDQLATAVAGGDTGAMATAALKLIESAGHLVTGFADLADALNAAGPGLPGITAAQVTALTADLPRKLLDLLLADVLELSPAFGAVMNLFGVVRRDYQAGVAGDASRPGYDKLSVHLDRLLPAITDPLGALQDRYGWGGSGFDASALLTALEGILGRLGLPVALVPAGGGQPVQLQTFVLDLRPTDSGSPPGLQLGLTAGAGATASYDFPISPPAWVAHVAVEGKLPVGVTGTLRPPFDVKLTPPGGTLTGSATVSLNVTPAQPFVLLGEAGGSRLEFATMSLGAGITLAVAGGKATGTPTVTGQIAGGKLVIDASKGDGFLSTLLGGSDVESDFDLGFELDPTAGLRFSGSGALQIRLPLHLQLGPIEIDAVYLVAKLAGDTIPIELSAAFSAALGPLQASVDRMGALVTIGFPAGGGNAGPAQLDFAFKPPNGVGLSVDAGIVTGGGYLYVDPDRGEYSGAMQLEFADFLSLSAIGLISTRMPDGSPGFSLLIIIAADFGSGIQLGFGFTLNAVGGLLGVNRVMLFQAVMDGVRTGAIDSIMFPHDVVANAPKIISDLRAIFPPRQGTFLVGPMAKLGWGEPTLVSLSLGVIVEVPPGDIAILGVLRLALPADQLAIIVLQVNFAGALEFSKSRLYFFASLYDSHILFITISGELGLLFAWGDDANFVVSVGGFHPQFNPPPLPFPTPRRIAVDIINESFARIHCDGYFAVTSNSVQFGTHADFFFGFSALSVSGHASFDALIQFSPFHFSISFSTGFSVQVFGVGVFGIDISLTVEGVTPWHASGTASLTILFFTISVGIDFTWGDDRNTTLPPVAVLPIVSAEFGKQSNWRAVLPAGARLLVALRALPEDESRFVLHPVGTLQVSQRAVPLDLTIDKVGNQKPTDVDRLRLSVTSPDLVKTRDLRESFAPSQFLDTDDATKLSEPAYAPQDGGIELSAAGQALACGTAIVRIVRYDVTIIDTKLRRVFHRFTAYAGALFQVGLRGNATARSARSARRDAQTHPYAGSVRLAAETFAVAHQSDNTVYHPDAAAFASQASARDYLRRTVAADPTLATTLHVLPQFEVAS